MPSLIDRIGGIFRKAGSETAATTSAAMPVPSRPTALMDRFAEDRTRYEIMRTCRAMYEGDTRAKGVIQTLARDMTRGGFTVTVKESMSGSAPAAAEDLIAAMVKRLNLNSVIDDWVRLALRDGDSFLELGINDLREITMVTRKPVMEMHRASNRFDGFDDPERAYYQVAGIYGSLEPGTDAIWYADWQIIHARWDHDEGQRYGRPLFAAATSAYKRVSEGEKDIAVRRKTRAGVKYNHRFPDGTPGTVIDEYMHKNKAALDNPWAAVADFFGTTDIKTVQGDAQLGEISDVMHHIRTWWLSSPVPMSLLGYGQDLNRDVLEKQKEQYDESLQTLQEWVTDQIVRPLVETEWLLHGILPEHLTYDVIWKRKRVITPKDLRDLGEAALRLKQLGWDDQALRTLMQEFLPGIDLDGMIAPTAGNASASRVAQSIAKLSGASTGSATDASTESRS